ncbi:hypothetical protein IAD21_06006 [Abditibacteriota bacterium]|nr:hypothetical protein IAD21_06006 [Abditibacteriota bacterium]
MAKSKSHSKQHSSKSKVVRKGAGQNLAPKTKAVEGSAPVEPKAPVTVTAKTAPPVTAPAFSAANASLQKVSTPQTSEATKVESVEAVAAPVEQSAPKTTEESSTATPKTPSEPTLELAPEFAAPTKPAPKVAKQTTQAVLPNQVVREVKEQHSVPAPTRRKWAGRVGVWVGGGLGALLLVAGGAAAGAYSKFASGDTIAPGVSIAGVPVGGLTPEVASERVLSHFGQPKISLLCDGETVQMPISDLGAKLSIEPTVQKAYKVGRDGFLPNNLLRVYGNGGDSKNFMLPIEWDKVQLVDGLHEVDSKITIKPVDARLRAAAVGLEVVPDREGRALNVGAAAHLLQRKFYVGMPSLHVPAREVEAKIKASTLDGRDVQLGQYTTHYNPGLVGRTKNLHIACSAIQNHVLMPGETFSFNGCTGERTLDKGYRMGHIFLRQPGAAESEVVEGLAGGVCQVSTTLFNAVRKTNAASDVNPLKIVERNTHSLPVTYVPHGFDATVAWPYKDFKFRNVATYPVYIRTQIGGASMNISVWGRIPNT